MSIKVAVVYEAAADFFTATELADRVLVESIGWMDQDSIAHHRSWVGTSTNEVFLTWKQLKHLTRDAGIVSMGHFEGRPAMPDAHAARRAILYLRRIMPDLDGIVLIRDQDDQPERRQGLEQARRQEAAHLPIVIGLAVVERESWVISGFEPRDDIEAARLGTERQSLGFDPRERSHDLTACKNDLAPRSPKRVLRVLTGGNVDRERQCWIETSLQQLRERGRHNGLTEYLDEVRARLAMLIGHIH